MANTQNTPISEASNTQLVWEGLFLGGKTGFVVSTVYAAVGFFVIEILGKGLGFLASPFEMGDFGKFILAILAVITMIFFLAVLPATIIGAITGMCFGQVAKLIGERMLMPRHLFLALCISSCLAVTILLHTLFKIPITLSFQSSSLPYSFGIYETYPFVIGIPSVIYVLTGIWVGWKLYSKAGIQRDGRI